MCYYCHTCGHSPNAPDHRSFRCRNPNNTFSIYHAPTRQGSKTPTRQGSKTPTKRRPRHIDPETKKQYTGAGVLMTMMVGNKYCIVAVYDKSRETYMLPGGFINPKNTLRCDALFITAGQEMYEESACVVNLTNKSGLANIPHTDMKEYRLFLFQLPRTATLVRDYYNNLSIINSSSRYSRAFRETNEMVLIPLDQFDAMSRGDAKCITIDNKCVTMGARDAEGIRQFKRNRDFTGLTSHQTRVEREIHPNGIITYNVTLHQR
jgi:hypothetical protein